MKAGAKCSTSTSVLRRIQRKMDEPEPAANISHFLFSPALKQLTQNTKKTKQNKKNTVNCF